MAASAVLKAPLASAQRPFDGKLAGEMTFTPRTVLLALGVLLAAASVADAAVARKKLEPSPDHPGKCFDHELQLVLEPGASEPARGECLQYGCERNDDGFELVITSCGSVAAPPGCVLGKPDSSLPYPQCCPKPKC